MSAFIDMLMRLKDRAEQELGSSTSDTLPNPVAGLMGPQEFHYNPLRDLPGVGGAINLAANGPLHGAGLVTEGAGEFAKGLFGALTLAAAAGQRAVGDENSEAGRDAARILAAGQGGHLGRALDAARTSEDDLVSYLAGAGEIASNPMNYANSIGAAGKALGEAPGIAGGIGKAIQGTGMALEGANRASMLPLAFLPRVRGSLTELPEYLKGADAPREIAPLIAKVRESLTDNAPLVENLGNNLDTASRAPLNADIEVPSPSGDVVQRWLERDRATSARPQGEPGGLAAPDWLKQTLLKNLDAEHGQKYGRLPRNVQPGQVALDAPAETSALFPESVPQESPLIKTASGQAPIPLEPGLAQDQVDFLDELQHAVQRGDPGEIQMARQMATEMMEIPPERVQRALDEVYGTLATEERQARLQAIEGSPYFGAFKFFNRDGNLKLVNPKTGKRLVNRSGAEVWNLPGSGYDEYAAEALQGVEGGGNQNFGQTADEFWGRAKEALAEYRALKAPVAEAAGRAAAAGEALPEAIPAHPELDAMDALRGQESAANIFELFRKNYGTTKNFKAVTGVGTLNGEGRLITKDGEDRTRGLLAYLLHRADLTPEERDAFQRGAFAAERPAVSPGAAADIGTQAAATATDAPPLTLRDLATDPQFSGQELPGPGYFARKLGIDQQAVNRGLAALADEGTIAPLNKWYGLKPEPPPAALGLPDVADDARAAWQREYVGQSKAGTDILSSDVAGSGIGQADLNAMSPADRMAALRKLTETPASASPVDDLFGTAAEQASTAPKDIPTGMPVAPPDSGGKSAAEMLEEYRRRWPLGGDNAAGGGGMGIQFQPTRLGVAASGAGLGGVAGLMAADTTDADHQDDWGGAVGGALAGAALGAGLASPGGVRNLRFAGELGKSALAKQGDAFATGDKAINWQNISGSWSGQTVENVRNLIQEALSSVPMLKDKGGSLAVVVENANAIKDAYIAGARDAHSLLPDRARSVVSALGLTDTKGLPLVPDMGVSGFMEATGRMDSQLNPMTSAIIEGLLPSVTPLGSVPVLGNVLGAAKGFTAPIRKEVYTTIDGITKSSFRSAIWEVATKDAAEDAARLFAQSVLDKTGRTLNLPADGLFAPSDVRAALVNVPSGTRDALTREWATYAQAINKTGEDAAKQAFGDFSKFDPATATRGEKVFHGFETGLRKVVPFSSWYIRALPIAAEIASHHPAFTLATLGVLADQARQLKAEGKPGYMVGTVPFDSDTPVIGKAADALTGGRGGTARVNVLNGILPFAGQALGADELGDDATLYQRVESWAGRAGFSFNPIVQGVMYAIGQDWQRPGAMSRTANLEQALPGPEGPSLLQGPLDFIRKQGGNSVSTTTPVDRRVAQIVFEQTGLPINDPANAAIAAATLDPKNPIVQQAEREVAQGNVAKNVTSLTVPVQVTASTALDQQIGAARAAQKASGTDPFPQQTPEQAAAEAVFAKAYPLQYAIAKGQPAPGAAPVDPLTQIYRGADTRGRAYQALAAWEDENAALKYFAPTYYGSYKKDLMQQLGLSPY